MRKYVNAVFQNFVKYLFDIKTNIGIIMSTKIHQNRSFYIHQFESHYLVFKCINYVFHFVF